ncbi:hypothetical protein [Labilibaculum euxinus]|uniref:Uncharacterized protein n=1 Tax=Labilibaculum euxinus TaxID=2686357 RepID=A0A7M4DB80_9BACT|nr:hypothetical protein [Labilibaculum euxinus]MUP39909.1 hypothetical protein [Labilibaculum euxinus]MVB09114.1 hypothetical protein [Labilibaculum euxinus]
MKIKGHDMSCPYGFREQINCMDLLYCAWQGHVVSVLMTIHRIPINYFQTIRKLLSSSTNYFIEFENQGHLKIKGRDMSCTYGFREPIICVGLLYCVW